MQHGILTHGIRANLTQFLHQLLQVMLVGFTIGHDAHGGARAVRVRIRRAEELVHAAHRVRRGVRPGQGHAQFRSRSPVGAHRAQEGAAAGLAAALPIPLLVYFAPSWSWIVAATVLLGINQGLTWSMTQTSKLDITRADQRGLTIGLNEFSGYVGLRWAGIITAYLATMLGARSGLLVFA